MSILDIVRSNNPLPLASPGFLIALKEFTGEPFETTVEAMLVNYELECIESRLDELVI